MIKMIFLEEIEKQIIFGMISKTNKEFLVFQYILKGSNKAYIYIIFCLFVVYITAPVP